MIVYKVINKINGRWYIGQDSKNDSNYYGSGKLISQALKKYGKENFEKVILEHCSNKEHLSEREKHWIKETNALTDPLSYNLAKGGEGGDLSKFHDYSTHRDKNDKFVGAQKWFKSLSEQEQKDWHAKQAEKRCKGWYVSRVDDPTETFVKNIAAWCRENNMDTGDVSSMCNPKSYRYQMQAKGWRVRKASQDPLPPLVDKRTISRDHPACKGKTWKTVDGKRVWLDK